MSEFKLKIDQSGFINFEASLFKYNGFNIFSLLEFKFKNHELVKRILEYIIPEKREICIIPNDNSKDILLTCDGENYISSDIPAINA